MLDATKGVRKPEIKAAAQSKLQHDFLWRSPRVLPERGRIGIFNRSYYEEVLVVCVHVDLLKAEAVDHTHGEDKSIWHDRYRSIKALEKHLHANGTHIVNFFGHLSKDEQRMPFLERIDDPEKNWKFSMADIKVRGFWNEYMKVYENG